MPLICLRDAHLDFGHHPLLDGAECQIDAGERVCLVGRNGAGKSTLMNVLRGAQPLDDGELWVRPGLRIAHLAQDLPPDDPRTVLELVTEGLDAVGRHIRAYHAASARLADGDEKALAELAEAQQALEANDGWRLEQRVMEAVTRLGLPPYEPIARLSGGVRRRALLARALVSEPDLLLLDEPTNHLDIQAIDWLEGFLNAWRGTLLFITHDRAFLQNLATRILELDRGRLTSWPGDYRNYLEKKAEREAVEARQAARFDKKLAQEEAWIRQGIRARRTRNEGRVRALQRMRAERAARRDPTGPARLQLQGSDLSGRLVAKLDGVTIRRGDRTLVEDLDLTILRGDRVGIVGPNGAGKSTLLEVILGHLRPDAGRVLLGSRLEIAYFDQKRNALDPDKTVLENLNLVGDRVTVQGKSRHVVGYLKDFLFPPQRVNSPVSSLSGGERNRLLLARLFTRPANVLVLDEPTNDLDVETLELLEDLLLGFDGTLLVVSHDRAFLDNVVTSTLLFEGDGRVHEYIGGYSDALRQSRERARPAEPAVAKAAPAKPARPKRARKGLSYKEKRELEALPARLETLEAEQAALQARLSDPAFYQGDKDELRAALARAQAIEAELETLLGRWEELEQRAQESG